jgi:hypothetical protein
MFEQIDSTDSIPMRDVPQVRRRAAVRYRCHLATPARVAREGAEGHLLAWVHNLSHAGVGLLLGSPVDVGGILSIDLLTASGDRIHIGARVAHATRRIDAQWLIGCEFLRPLDPFELESLL